MRRPFFSALAASAVQLLYKQTTAEAIDLIPLNLPLQRDIVFQHVLPPLQFPSKSKCGESIEYSQEVLTRDIKGFYWNLDSSSDDYAITPFDLCVDSRATDPRSMPRSCPKDDRYSPSTEYNITLVPSDGSPEALLVRFPPADFFQESSKVCYISTPLVVLYMLHRVIIAETSIPTATQLTSRINDGKLRFDMRITDHTVDSVYGTVGVKLTFEGMTVRGSSTINGGSMDRTLISPDGSFAVLSQYGWCKTNNCYLQTPGWKTLIAFSLQFDPTTLLYTERVRFPISPTPPTPALVDKQIILWDARRSDPPTASTPRSTVVSILSVNKLKDDDITKQINLGVLGISGDSSCTKYVHRKQKQSMAGSTVNLPLPRFSRLGWNLTSSAPVVTSFTLCVHSSEYLSQTLPNACIKEEGTGAAGPLDLKVQLSAAAETGVKMKVDIGPFSPSGEHAINSCYSISPCDVLEALNKSPSIGEDPTTQIKSTEFLARAEMAALPMAGVETETSSAPTTPNAPIHANLTLEAVAIIGNATGPMSYTRLGLTAHDSFVIPAKNQFCIGTSGKCEFAAIDNYEVTAKKLVWPTADSGKPPICQQMTAEDEKDATVVGVWYFKEKVKSTYLDPKVTPKPQPQQSSALVANTVSGSATPSGEGVSLSAEYNEIASQVKVTMMCVLTVFATVLVLLLLTS